MAVRDRRPASHAALRTSSEARHLGRGAGLVDEHQALRVEVRLRVEPGVSLRRLLQRRTALKLGDPYDTVIGLARPSEPGTAATMPPAGKQRRAQKRETGHLDADERRDRAAQLRAVR